MNIFNRLKSCKTFIFNQISRSLSQSISDGVSVYIHWPYCKKLCTYCNFNKYVKDTVDQERVVACLVKEWKTLKDLYSIHRPVTIFFGGGTPSLIHAKHVEKIVKVINSQGYDIEVSLEANPGDIVGKVKDLKNAGITRLSIGVQAFNDIELKFLNRDHNVKQALELIRESLNLFPKSTSVDLIFGRPGQTVDTLEAELSLITDLGLPHVSLYQLTVERGTQLDKQVRAGEVTMPCEDTMAEMYSCAVDTLTQAGVERYEVSNFSVPGSECVHNMGYWSARQYVGLGPGAHSRLSHAGHRMAMRNIPYPEHWMAEVERVGHGVRSQQQLPVVDSMKELLATGLRTRKGISLDDWRRVSDQSIDLKYISTKLKKIEEGFSDSDGNLRLSHDKINVLDNILPEVFNVLDKIKV